MLAARSAQVQPRASGARSAVARSAQLPRLARGPCSSAPSTLPIGVWQHGSTSSGRRDRSVACNGLFGLGLPEIAVIAGIAALVFGPSKLPELGKGLGKTFKSFQTAAKEFETELKQASAEDPPAAEAKKAEEPKKP